MIQLLPMLWIYPCLDFLTSMQRLYLTFLNDLPRTCCLSISYARRQLSEVILGAKDSIMMAEIPIVALISTCYLS